MVHKVLQKARNQFLSQTPLENLMPNKRIRKKENLYRRFPQEKVLTIHRYLANASANKKSSQLLIGESRIPIFSFNTFFPHVKKKLQLIGMIDKKKEISSKSLVSFLNQNSTPVAWPSVVEVNKEQLRLIPETQPYINSSPKILGNKRKDVVTPFTFLEKNEKYRMRQPQFFLIKWSQSEQKKENNLALGEFLRKQLFRDVWHCFSSVHDLSNKRTKFSDQFKNQYIEYKKLAILYGNLPRRTLARVMRRARKEGGEIESKFLSTLERRLDVALKRLFFFPTIESARQWIHQGKILVNSRVCIYTSYLLQPGDFICIRKEKQALWRKEWFHSFRTFRTGARNHIFLEKNFKTLSSISSKKELHAERIVPKERRFLFPPFLMKKWTLWSKLWSSCLTCPLSENAFRWCGKICSSGCDCSVCSLLRLTERYQGKSATLGSAWMSGAGKKAHMWGDINNSVLMNLFSPGEIERLYGKEQKWAKVSKNPKVQERTFSLLHRLNTKVFQQLKEQKLFSKKKNLQLLSSALFSRQQPYVVDGLYQLRWNKIFIKKKLILFKRKDWQWGCIKALHFECSYTNLTAIYLYSPQKLVWPSSINILLIKKAFF